MLLEMPEKSRKYYKNNVTRIDLFALSIIAISGLHFYLTPDATGQTTSQFWWSKNSHMEEIGITSD